MHRRGPTGTMGFGRWSVSGLRRCPRPPDMMTAFTRAPPPLERKLPALPQELDRFIGLLGDLGFVVKLRLHLFRLLLHRGLGLLLLGRPLGALSHHELAHLHRLFMDLVRALPVLEVLLVSRLRFLREAINFGGRLLRFVVGRLSLL